MVNVSYDDFAKLDIRIAKIISVEPIPNKTRIVKGKIDLGTEIRDVIIGGAQYYQLEDLVDKIVVAVVNLEPKTLAGIQSNAMLLAADVNDKPFWITTNEDVPLGSAIK